MKRRSVSATVDGSGQSASWQKCVWSFISLEALVFKKTELNSTNWTLLSWAWKVGQGQQRLTAVGRAHHGKRVYAVSLAWKHWRLGNELNAQPHCSFCHRQWRCRKVTPMSLLLTKAVVTIIILQKAQLPRRGATPGKKKKKKKQNFLPS